MPGAIILHNLIPAEGIPVYFSNISGYIHYIVKVDTLSAFRHLFLIF